MKNSFSINIVFLVLSIMGLSLIPKVSLQLKPNQEDQRIYVAFNWGNISAEVVEKEVTSPIEAMLASLKGISYISSESKKGRGRITASFKEGVDIDASRFEVSSMVRSIYKKLPRGVTRPYVYTGHGNSEDPLLMRFIINGEGSNCQLQQYAENNIAPDLGKISDISKVEISGAMPLQWQVNYNKEKMKALGLSVDHLQQSIYNVLQSNEIGSGINSKGRTLHLSYKGQLTDSIDWNYIIVGKSGPRIIRLTDIANVKLKEQEPRSYYRVNGLNTIYLRLYSSQGTNQVEVAQKVKEELKKLKITFPANFSIILDYDASEEIKTEVSQISLRAIMAIGILLAFVLAISRNWRYLMVISISLIVNLLIAVLFYKLLDIEIHIFSLAGITVSLGIIIDNTIVMVDHIRHCGNKKAFLAILSATLTTIGAMTVIFFLKQYQRVNLIDFAWVLIINLTVSLFVALWFIPAFMDKFPLFVINTKRNLIRKKKRTGRWSNRYYNQLCFYKKWKWVFLIAIMWGFGLPTFLIPEGIEINEKKGEKPTWWSNTFNTTLGNTFYIDNIRPWINKILGGSLNYFASYVDNYSMDSGEEHTRLWVNVSMPDGATIQQMNEVFLDFENHLARFKEVDKFVSNVSGIDHSTIEISLKKEAEDSPFPYVLKQHMETKAIETGGADFSIYGVGRGFNNAVGEGTMNNAITLKGYNYDQLVYYARNLKDTLLNHPRIHEVIIQTGTSWRGKPRYEFVMKLNSELLAASNSSINNVYHQLSYYSPQERVVGYERRLDNTIPIVIKEESNLGSSIWEFKNNMFRSKKDYLRLKNVGTIKKERTGNLIRKHNQQYSINVEYDFIGPYQLSKRVLERNIETLKKELPLGYSVENKRSYGWWDRKEKTQYWLIILVIGVVYIICSILLESLVQPLVVIATIPISFIGMFLTFSILKLKFDQGGYASMILLCGITVNSALYIINDYNNIQKSNPRLSRSRCYLKAFNHKIIPILLTVLSTILGLIPFLLEGIEKGFWFSLSCGAIGGLLFSVLAIWIWLPLFMNLNTKKVFAN